MKRKGIFLLPLCLAAAAAVWAVAAGDAADPLASLSYLQGTFSGQVDAAVERKLDESDAQLRNQGGAVQQPADGVSSWTEVRLKAADTLSASTGSSVLLLAGTGTVSYSYGAVVDVTAGAEVPSGTLMAANHRYMAAEDTEASFIITSKTAVLDYQGAVQLAYSGQTDYNAMAGALKALHLFKGSFTGYGQGFDLELSPTRLQALIMFIRVLGEEDQALAWTGTTPFKDIPAGSQAEQYVGYAYSRGYTNGSAANTNLADALERAQSAGVLTAGEAAMLQNPQFLRADLVYISYYALSARLPDGQQSLADQLINQGVFTATEWAEAQGMVASQRL